MAAAGPVPELLTADDARVRACTAGGVDHDYRPHFVPDPARTQRRRMVNQPIGDGEYELSADVTISDGRTYWRCVWCHGVSCGDFGEHDPCIEPYHHRVPHRTRTGLTWPIGGNRP